MKELMDDIVKELKERGSLDARRVERIIARHNRRFHGPQKHFAKKQLTPYYFQVKRNDPQLWTRWGISDELERILLAAIQVKPRRTASGVATITVITKPHPCAGNCLYCPNDVRMPKSYLHAEPACQRAERSFFDPYLQVASRLAALARMGHATDKVELIVLGGTFTDYPQDYQAWFIHELFRALNDADAGTEGVSDVFAHTAHPFEAGAAQPKDETAHQATSGNTTSEKGVGGVVGTEPTHSNEALFPYEDTLAPLAQNVRERMALYVAAGLPHTEETLVAATQAWQDRVNNGRATFNEAVADLYGPDSAWDGLNAWQKATLGEVSHLQAINEDAAHRVVGLVVETRPDAIDSATLLFLRQLGCTKLQMGVQTLNPDIASACQRPDSLSHTKYAFELARAFGFKSHAHFMANLPQASPEGDKADYATFVNDPQIAPDEVKLYPCALIGGTALEGLYDSGAWQPYDEETLVDVLAADVLITPAHTRISRMIRDFSSDDIKAGNKKTNLRQMVEQRVAQLVEQGARPPQEIRIREIATDETNASELALREEHYETSNSDEYFLQWVTPENRIAGFLRLSLPHTDWIDAHKDDVAVVPGEAMIREVHVYGAAARLHAPTTGAQHQGLGRTLVERACELAQAAGYDRINVISAVGTRNYYRALGFMDGALYLQRPLSKAAHT